MDLELPNQFLLRARRSDIARFFYTFLYFFCNFVNLVGLCVAYVSGYVELCMTLLDSDSE